MDADQLTRKPALEIARSYSIAVASAGISRSKKSEKAEIRDGSFWYGG